MDATVIVAIITALALIVKTVLDKLDFGKHKKSHSDMEKQLEAVQASQDALSNSNKNIQHGLGLIEDRLGTLDLSTKRLEIMNLMQHSPLDRRAICKAYDEYKESGGNSYITAMFAYYLKHGDIEGYAEESED
ncbi:hypothetical protein FACS18949_15250 [Clostridia bacterium]|nr:hypothetical protein FACS189425_08770 [Clostridia bacterium]GHV36171.1 hypothetical protein FACS18949_15250 [Clostridia bacterium]